ncbi:MAG: arginine--tRNA ligase [Actinomycetia bacterium]|nr:arginine--tRNA ligase [Actinomycetes bacterium]
MFNLVVEEHIKLSLKKAKKEGLFKSEKFPEITIEKPKEKTHGDLSCNIAFLLSAQEKKSPLKIAEIILSIQPEKKLEIDKVEIAGKGFINFFISLEGYIKEIEEIISEGKKYGDSDIGKEKKVQIEFVSANPVGPMHIGHGRWAAVGDSMARLFEKTGHEVVREFYINDYGNQMNIFGKSVAARYMEILGRKYEMPEDGYQGEYVYDIAREIKEKEGDKYVNLPAEEREEEFKEIAFEQVMEHLRKILIELDVKFDIWFLESSLHQAGKVNKTIDILEKKGFVDKKDGAIWLKATEFGDDKDRVLIRANGEPTYFAADVAYHRDKQERGFDKVIDIWGADHHGYVKRVKASMKALGFEDSFLEIIIGQLVNLKKGNLPIRMSKRTGEMVTLEELMHEVGKDGLRYFFVSKSTDTPLDFDIELAKKQSSENPVYYVQYAHARICSVINFAKDKGFIVPELKEVDLHLLQQKEERELMKKLSQFPEEVLTTLRLRAPYRLTIFAQELASIFHVFYTECRVISDDKELSKARVILVKAAQIVLKDVLNLIGVSAPQKM